MTPLITHKGVAAALRRDNIDTDIIIPMLPMLTVPLDRIGEVAFQPIRFLSNGHEDARFVLNQPAYRGASILITGRNFGSGSSRERAVNAVAGLGIRVIIAPSFGDIFYGNCFKNGLLPIRLDDAAVATLMDCADKAAGSAPFTVDLVQQTITATDDVVYHFDIESGLKQRMLSGEDDIAVTLKQREAIAAFQARDRRERPWIWELGTDAALAS
jgi:3-isopropylmalate/(R)-2-methylmalate dehydratase small subunit